MSRKKTLFSKAQRLALLRGASRRCAEKFMSPHLFHVLREGDIKGSRVCICELISAYWHDKPSFKAFWCSNCRLDQAGLNEKRNGRFPSGPAHFVHRPYWTGFEERLL